MKNVYLTADQTRAWARFQWPCSFLSGKVLTAEFDSNGDLVDMSVNNGHGDQDCPADEFNAIVEEHQ